MIISVPAIRSNSGYILYETGYRQYSGEGTGMLSIKSFFDGQALYQVGHNYFLVGDSTHLILNHGQPYTIHIEAEQAVESFCVFFAEGFAEDIHHALMLPDDLETMPDTSLNFFEKTYHQDAFVTPAILKLRAGIKSGNVTTGWLEEQMHVLMQGLLHVHYNVYRELELLPAVRPATREELYRRVNFARDYATALFASPITLAELADIACMSPNHLLRTFNQVFGQTPHQYLITKRLEEAQRLLQQDHYSVTDICFAVGFESLGSFSTLFRSRFGMSPTEFRQQKR